MQGADSALPDGQGSVGSAAGREGALVALLADGIDTACKWAAYVACVCLGLLVLVLCVEIVARGFSSESPLSTWEYAGYLQAALVMLGAGYTLQTGGHIRVNLLMARLGQRGMRVLDILCSLLGLAVMAVICWALFDVFWSSLQTDRRSYFVSATPLWVPQAVLVLGSVLLALQFAARVVKGVLGLQVEHDEEGIAGFGAE
jgi:TRAP-type C4-dicarboxylate transport system permease small subunit